jgi:hypothetical protein
MSNLGQLIPIKPPGRPEKPKIPRQLRTMPLEYISGSLTYQASVERYGLWEVESLEQDGEYFGHRVTLGDRFSLPGNTAVQAALCRQVRFTDARLEHEERILKEAAKLNIPIPARETPAFARNAAKGTKLI